MSSQEVGLNSGMIFRSACALPKSCWCARISRIHLCPVNQNDGCIGCHMPTQVVNGFPMADHWIRVHPELPAPPHKRTPTLRTRVVPVSEFLSVISVTDERAANDILRQLESGAAFFDLARKYSTDASAPNGG